MKFLIIVIAAMIVFAGSVMAVTPKPLLDYIQRHGDRAWLYAFAVIVRLVLGAALIVYAPQSAFPTALFVLGCIAVAAAAIILVIGPGRLRRLIDRVVGIARPFARLAGLVAIAFGAFLIYAVR